MRTSSTVACDDASGRTATVGSRRPPARPGAAAGSPRPAPDDGLVARPQHGRIEVGHADLPHGDAVLLLRPGPGGAHRIRCSANIAAKSASRPTRSGAMTVTRVPSAVVLDGDRRRSPAYLVEGSGRRR